jgi:hypothetical protein
MENLQGNDAYATQAARKKQSAKRKPSASLQSKKEG